MRPAFSSISRRLFRSAPASRLQTIHRDQWAFDFFPFPRGYEVQCNTIWAMTDFTAENGATRVIPGSNHFDDKLRFTEADTEPAEMSKGSVSFLHGQPSITAAAPTTRKKSAPESTSPTTSRGSARRKSIFVGAARYRPHTARRPAATDGLSPRRLRARLCRRHARSNGVSASDLARTGFRPALETPESASFLTTQPRASIEKSE